MKALPLRFLLPFCLQLVQIIPVVIIRGQEGVLHAATQSNERGSRKLHWDVNIISVKEFFCFLVCFIVLLDHNKRGIILSGMNSVFPKIKCLSGLD